MIDLDASKIIIQIIGFLVMLWIMKRYGWQPLLDVLEERRKKIQKEFDDIAAQKDEVKQMVLLYEEKLNDIEGIARKKIQEAIAEGRKISVEIQEEAQAIAKETGHKAKLEAQREMAKAKTELKNDLVNLVVDTTEKIIQEKLDATSQKKLIAGFINESDLK